MKMLIALAAIAAAAYVADQPAFEKDQLFPAPDDIAEKMIADGVAKLADDKTLLAATQLSATVSTKKTAKLTKARLLIDCEHGKANTVVSLDADALKQAEAAGIADSNKAAVAYAEGLPAQDA